MKDGTKVGAAFSLGAERNLVENHDAATGSSNNELDDLDPEASQSAAVGNHNLELLSAHCPFQ